LAQDLLGWINLKPPSSLAANVGNAVVWDGLIEMIEIKLFEIVFISIIFIEIKII